MNASESEMFPSDDDGKSVDAAAGEAAKMLLDNKAFETELEMEYKNKPAVDLVIDGKHYDPDSETPNFDIIIYELNKMETSEEILQVKSLLVKIQNLLDFESDIDDNPVHNDGSENVLNSDRMQNPVVDDSKDSTGTGMNNVQHVNFPLFHDVGENLQVPGSVSNPAVMNEVQNQLHPSLQVTGNPHVSSGSSGMNQFQHITNPVLNNQPVVGSMSNLGFQWNAAGGQFPIGVLNIVQQQHVQQVQPQPQVSKFVITDESGRPSITTLPSDTAFLVQNGPPGSYFLANMANVELNSLQNKCGITDELRNYRNIMNEKEKDDAKTEKTEQDIENEEDKQNHTKSDAGDNKREIEIEEKDNDNHDDTVSKNEATEEVSKKEPEKVENAEGNGKPSDKKEDLEGEKSKSKKDNDKRDTGPNNNITIIDAKEGDGLQNKKKTLKILNEVGSCVL